MNYLNPLSPPSALSALSAPYPNLFAALSAVPTAPPPAVGLQWIAVRPRFTQFHSNLSLTPTQFLDGMTKRNGVANRASRPYSSFADGERSGHLTSDSGIQIPVNIP